MKKLLVLGCNTLREGVLVSVTFFVSGILFILTAQYVVPAVMHMDLVILLLGFLMLLIAPVVMLSTFLLSVLPKGSYSEKCDP